MEKEYLINGIKVIITNDSIEEAIIEAEKEERSCDTVMLIISVIAAIILFIIAATLISQAIIY